jgi:hypothetical protein
MIRARAYASPRRGGGALGVAFSMGFKQTNTEHPVISMRQRAAFMRHRLANMGWDKQG